MDVEQAIHSRDFGKLHETLARCEPSAVAAEARGLPLEDQAVVFRILPQGCAAAAFEYHDVAPNESL